MYPNNLLAFDINDCKVYDLKYNTQFYFKVKLEKKTKIIQDIYYIGIDKDRIKSLEKFIYLLQKNERWILIS